MKMHQALGWLDVKNRLLYLLAVMTKNVIVSKCPTVIYERLFFSSDTHTYPTRHAVGGCFTLPKSNTFAQRTVTFRAMHEWNSLPYTLTQLHLYGFKKQLKQHYLNMNFAN